MVSGSPFAIAAQLATEFAVNRNAFSSAGCFSFNLTMYSGETGEPAAPICSNDPGYPFAGSLLEDCDRICFPSNMMWEQTNCTASKGAPAAESILSTAPDVVAVIGASCSGVSKAASPVLAAADVPLVSPSSTDAELTNVTAYPNFFMMNSPDSAQAYALVDLAAKLNVTSASVVASESFYSESLAEGIIDLFPSVGIELATYEILQAEDAADIPANQLEPVNLADVVGNLSASGATAIFSTGYCGDTMKVKELAATYNMTTADDCYTWIGGDANTHNNCVPSDAWNGSVGMQYIVPSGGLYDELVRLWSSQDRCDYQSQVHNGYDLERFSNLAFDAVLAVATAIQNVLDAGGDVSGSSVMAALASPNFLFEGTSGLVRFGGDYDGIVYGAHARPYPMAIESAVDEDFTVVGSWNPTRSDMVSLDDPAMVPPRSRQSGRCP